MEKRLVAVLSVLLVLLALMPSAEAQQQQQQQLPTLDMSGFSWAENLAFDSNGNLFVSDASTGKIWRIFLSSRSNSYSRAVHLSGFDGCLGLAASQDGSQMFSAVKYKNTVTNTTQHLIISFDPAVSGKWKQIAELPKPGNGLALDYATDLLYSATEGFFLPRAGEVFEISMSGEVNTIMTELYSADGLWIDQKKRLLYVSEVLTAKFVAYDLQSNSVAFSFRAPSLVKSVDDFCLSPDGSTIIGADFLNGTVVSFPSSGGGVASLIATDIAKATSVRWGVAPSFNSTALYVTQGGGLSKFSTSRKVLEVAAPPFLLHSSFRSLYKP